jgi:hypothetical protein
MVEWKIGRKAGACAGCSRSFGEGEAHLSVLVLRAEEPLRQDLCQPCFAGRAAPGNADAELELFWWRTHFRAQKRRGLALDLEAIEGLFAALVARCADAPNAALSELRYVLCLILMRKRRLKIERIARDPAGETMIVRRPRREEELRVAVHDFTPERTAELRDQLVRLFDGGEAELQELVPTPEPAREDEAP